MAGGHDEQPWLWNNSITCGCIGSPMVLLWAHDASTMAEKTMRSLRMVLSFTCLNSDTPFAIPGYNRATGGREKALEQTKNMGYACKRYKSVNTWRRGRAKAWLGRHKSLRVSFNESWPLRVQKRRKPCGPIKGKR
ncbi:MAG: hypothetical protein WDN06_18760 [Asticcacaulis sp.]